MAALGPISSDQLAKWQHYSRSWGILLQARETSEGHRLGKGVTQWHFACATCGQTMTVAHDGANPYSLNLNVMTDDVTRHLRQSHQEIEAVVYAVPIGV